MEMEFCKFLPDAPLYLIAEALGKYSIHDDKRCLRVNSSDIQCVGYDYTIEGVICDVFIKEKPHKAQWDGGIFVYAILAGIAKCNNRTIPAPVAQWLDESHGEYTTRKLQKILDLVRESNEKKRWQKWNGQQIAELICNCFGLQLGIVYEIEKQFKPLTAGHIKYGETVQ
jgi:hypothetical protein